VPIDPFMSRGFRSIVIAAGVLIPTLFLALMLASTPRPVHVAPAAAPPPVPGNPAAAQDAAQARAENAAAARERDWARSADHPSGADAVAKQPRASHTGTAATALTADADAKAMARDLVSRIESCWTSTRTYASCTNPTPTTLPIGSGPGHVSASGADATSYTVTAQSTAGQTFVITRHGPTGAFTRTCTPPGVGGCPSAGTW
jgi:hypothetical protein